MSGHLLSRLLPQYTRPCIKALHHLDISGKATIAIFQPPVIVRPFEDILTTLQTVSGTPSMTSGQKLVTRAAAYRHVSQSPPTYCTLVRSTPEAGQSDEGLLLLGHLGRVAARAP